MALNINGISLTSPAGTTLEAANGATSWLKIDATGRVTKGQTPLLVGAFNGQATTLSVGKAVFGSVVWNLPTAAPPWNNSTGNFTCPIAGRYLVYMAGIAQSGTGYFGILKNGVNICFSHWNHTTIWVPVQTSAVLYCALGDTISFCINAPPIVASNSSGWYGAGQHGSFAISLMK